MTQKEQEKTLRTIEGGHTQLEDMSLAGMVAEALGCHPAAIWWGAMLPGADVGSIRSQVAAAVNDAPEAIKSMRRFGANQKENKLNEYNHSCFAFENAHASIPSEITFDPKEYFPVRRKKDWPTLVLTSNHATARDIDDLGVIMHGWERLYQDTAPDPAPKVKVVSTLFSHDNRYLNGADLLQRLENIKNTDNDKSTIRNLRGIAPDSVQLGNMIISLLAKNPDIINLDGDLGRTTPYENVDDLPPLCKETNGKKSADQTIILRKDAAEIASHIKLAGYSRGGSVVTDALRYVARQMVPSERDHEKEEKSFPSFTIETPSKPLGRDLEPKDAEKILSNMPILAVAPWEASLNDREREIGLRRQTLLNMNDPLAALFFVGYNGLTTQPPKQDALKTMEGIEGKKAHDPRPALFGPCDETGTPIGEPGYFAADPEIAETLAKHFAAAPAKAQGRGRV